jgi:amphi-Trp domain-containing protein
MGARKRRSKRDIEKEYPRRQFVAKLRRLADCIEQGKRFRIQIAGERVLVPPSAVINIEHERGSSEEEIEFQLKWSVGDQRLRTV